MVRQILLRLLFDRVNNVAGTRGHHGNLLAEQRLEPLRYLRQSKSQSSKLLHVCVDLSEEILVLRKGNN